MRYQPRCSTTPEPDLVAMILALGCVALVGATVVLIAASVSGEVLQLVRGMGGCWK